MWKLNENVFYTVKTEATTLRWVNKNDPSVPTEEVVYDWNDPD